jgi:hypothetical protein
MSNTQRWIYSLMTYQELPLDAMKELFRLMDAAHMPLWFKSAICRGELL